MTLSYTPFTYCYFVMFCISQLPSMYPRSFKGTVQTSSPSSVDTVRLECGQTMGKWRVVKSLALPSLVQCILFMLQQNTPQPSLHGVDSVQALDGHIIQCAYVMQLHQEQCCQVLFLSSWSILKHTCSVRHSFINTCNYSVCSLWVPL